nr:hypothetical protein [Rhizobium sp. CC-CFT758]
MPRNQATTLGIADISIAASANEITGKTLSGIRATQTAGEADSFEYGQIGRVGIFAGRLDVARNEDWTKLCDFY